MRTYLEFVQWDTADEPFERIGTLLGSSFWREAHLPGEGIAHFRLYCRPLRETGRGMLITEGGTLRKR